MYLYYYLEIRSPWIASWRRSHWLNHVNLCVVFFY